MIGQLLALNGDELLFFRVHVDALLVETGTRVTDEIKSGKFGPEETECGSGYFGGLLV
jgi:hypothetical protein